MCNNYIKYSRDLHNHPVFKSFSYDYRHIFLTILINAAFKPISLNDHGVIIDLQPGQLMTTIRDLVRLCDEPTIDRSKVARALSMFEKCQFSRQETRHKKTIITITLSNVYEKQKNEIETTIETKSRQDRDKIETEKKNEKNDKNDIEIKEKIKKEKISKIKFRDFVELTQEEHDKTKELYKEKFEEALDYLDSYKGSSGKKYDSDFHAMKKNGWLYNKIIKESISDNKKNIKSSFQGNIDWARETIKKYAENSQNELNIGDFGLTFIPKIGQSQPVTVKFNDNGFKDQVENLLKKNGYRKIA